jgi:hypothetical protein
MADIQGMRECRAKKIRCDGGEPCRRCSIRALDCVYRTKARNRPRKRSPAPSAATQHQGGHDSHRGHQGDADEEDEGSRGLQNHSVAATHRASSSMLLQLYYGPSSNFSIINFIYHQIKGTRPMSAKKEV